MLVNKKHNSCYGTIFDQYFRLDQSLGSIYLKFVKNKMSNITYNKLFVESTDIICEATQSDHVLQNEKPQSDKSRIYSTICEVYFKYIIAANKLDQCYDQILQPQKRLLIRKLLDSCIGRILELKNDLVNIDISEYSYKDEVLQKLKISPMEAEINIPRYYTTENEFVITERRKFIEVTLRKLGYVEEEEPQIIMTESLATLVIQSHERARQGRLRGQFMKEIRSLKEKSKMDVSGKADLSAKSALLIQKVWRGFITRRAISKRKMDEMLLIGMIPPPYSESEVLKRAEKVIAYRRQVQAKYQQEYDKALEKTEKDIKEKRGGKIKEDVTDEIRHWFNENKEQGGKLPEFPSEESGGSRMIFSRQGTESEISKSTPVSSKESKRSKDKKSKSSDGKVKEEEPEFGGHKCAISNFLPDILTSNEEYEDVWKYRDETSNPRQKHYDEMILREKYSKVETEMRKVVDEMMRAELELLQAALDRDRAHKGKKAKKPPKKARRSGKKNKKKKEKDLTPDRTTESLFEELVANGIIKKYPLVPIDSFIGEKSFAADELRVQGLSPSPCLGDIRQVIKEFCILPLGSEYVHQNAPLIKSVLISGSQGSGKKMLVNAICTEVGAVLFDLTPANIVGKYPGKTGLIMLLHLVNKVARLLQPAVIWMDGAEKPFVKKIPKTDRTDPKRLKKDLSRIIKGISPEDRVLFVGTSYCPWDAEQKLLQQVYSKFIHIPKPDYGSLFFLWQTVLHSYTSISPHFDVSSIAKISDGYTVGTILSVIKSVITTKRMLQLRVRPLRQLELVSELSRREPVYCEEEELAGAWWWRTPLGRKLQRAIDLQEEEQREAQECEAK